MRIKQTVTLVQSTQATYSAATSPFPSKGRLRIPSSHDYSISKAGDISVAASGNRPNAPSTDAKSNNCTKEETLKLSYIILNEHISDIDAFSLLGRVVGNVKSPLENYAPPHVIPSAEISGLVKPTQSIPCPAAPGLLRQASNASDTSAISSASTIVEDQPRLDIDPSCLVFRNLPYVVAESTSATLSHFSHYTRKSESLLTSLLGLSIQSSKTTWKEFKLESKLIRTVSLTQHNLVWAQLLKTYKREVMCAVRKCGGTMFLVIGIKVARDADVEVKEAEEKGLGGKLEMDAGAYMGVKGLGAGKPNGGMGGVMGMGGLERVKGRDGCRKEKILGDRAFAVEYREVKLKTKLEIGKGARKRKSEENLIQVQQIRQSQSNSDTVTVNSKSGNQDRNTTNADKELLRIQQEMNTQLQQQLEQNTKALAEMSSQQATAMRELQLEREKLAKAMAAAVAINSPELEKSKPPIWCSRDEREGLTVDRYHASLPKHSIYEDEALYYPPYPQHPMYDGEAPYYPPYSPHPPYPPYPPYTPSSASYAQQSHPPSHNPYTSNHYQGPYPYEPYPIWPSSHNYSYSIQGAPPPRSPSPPAGRRIVETSDSGESAGRKDSVLDQNTKNFALPRTNDDADHHGFPKTQGHITNNITTIPPATTTTSDEFSTDAKCHVPVAALFEDADNSEADIDSEAGIDSDEDMGFGLFDDFVWERSRCSSIAPRMTTDQVTSPWTTNADLSASDDLRLNGPTPVYDTENKLEFESEDDEEANDDKTEYGGDTSTEVDDFDDDDIDENEYELELGEEIYVQELDSLF